MSHVHPRRRRFGAVSVALAAVAAAAVALPAAASPAAPTAAGPGQPLAARTPLGTMTPGKELARQRQGVVPGQVLVTLDAKTSVTPVTSLTGQARTDPRQAAPAPRTNSAPLDAKLRQAGATSLRPLFPAPPAAAADAPATVTRSQPDPEASDLSRTYVLRTADQDSAAVAGRLRGTAGVAYAEPVRYVNTMNTGGQLLPAGSAAKATAKAGAAAPGSGKPAPDPGSSLPANYALSTSAQALLNAGGVNAAGAFATLQGRFGQQPGAGQLITNVSIGDLTDQSMADAGDTYVQSNGPTTVLKDGQRYLDLPSMPLIPTYVADTEGHVDGAASTKDQDPSLDEVMLDFSVMAPLAHDRQRPGMTGSGYTDLLGIAPGADYRLVVPQQPTTDRIAGALLAAAHQSPRPDVITASLGFGTDAQGLPGRYLEDDPVIRSVVADIVRRDGIVVSISSNDGTRLYTPASVGPDGGSTPTDTAPNASSATSIDDDALSTAPSEVPDSGAIAAGATTLDDTLAAPADSPRSPAATTAETRISGFGTFSSGFGSRVDLSAPGDNVIAFSHTPGQSAQDVTPALNGGTSASAPEIAAAAAVVLQAAELGGQHLKPEQVRSLLERTGRAVPTPPQIDRPLHVGPQIDVTAATEEALGRKADSTPTVVRLSVAHRVTTAGLGSSFLETTDQNRVDLSDVASGGNGEGLVGPVTFAGDVTGLPAGAQAQYTLGVGSAQFRSSSPAIRVTPRQLLAAAGLPVVSTGDRNVPVTYRVELHGRTVATVRRTLTIGPSDGSYAEATAPHVPAVVQEGHAVTVTYDLTGVANTDSPQLVVSTAGHWNPALAPSFSPAWHQELTTATGTVTIPADAFTGGGGIYGIGIAQARFGANPNSTTYGEFAPVRVEGGSPAGRPVAPLLTGKNGVKGHSAEITRSAPGFSLRYDVRGIPGAKYAEAEFSAPAPTLYGSLNTFTNANGTALDNDGVDTPSSAHRELPAASGTVRLDALGLGLTTSAVHDVRVLALDSHHRVVGQASPLSTLTVDDGAAPDGSTVQTFAAAGNDSVVALRTASGATEVRHYSTATGAYGAVFASDPGEDSEYEVLGVAPAAHRALLVHRSAPDGDLRVETWNTATDTLAGRRTLASADYRFVVGKVDPGRARGALLLRATADNSDVVLPFDLADGTAGAPVAADLDGVPAGTYSLLDIDASTGDAYLAKEGGAFLCLGGVNVARVDLGSGAVTGAGSSSGCSHGFASDGAGTLYNLSATAISTKIMPTSVLGSLNTVTGESADPVAVRKGLSTALAVDGRNQLAVVSFARPEGTAVLGSQQGLVLDNNATSRLMVIDLRTGTVVRTLSGFSLAPQGGSLMHGGAMNSLQLDPATRTGWTYGPYSGQIQQFAY